jgi:hypothetical protein
MRALTKAEERDNLKHYTRQSGSSKTSFGDLLDESTAQKLKEAMGNTPPQGDDSGNPSENS